MVEELRARHGVADDGARPAGATSGATGSELLRRCRVDPSRAVVHLSRLVRAPAPAPAPLSASSSVAPYAAASSWDWRAVIEAAVDEAACPIEPARLGEVAPSDVGWVQLEVEVGGGFGSSWSGIADGGCGYSRS